MPKRKKRAASTTNMAPAPFGLPRMSVQEFVAKWQVFTGNEMAGYMAQFDDLCRVLGHPTPSELDPSQTWFCYQRNVLQEKGNQGFADVYYQGKFGWEYKGNDKDLDAAYRQLLQYRTNLQNPPLLIVSDFQRFRIHTAFNNAVTRSYEFTLADLLRPDRVSDSPWSAIELLRVCFSAPDALNPNLTPEELTRDAANKFAGIADDLRNIRRRGTDEPEYSDEQISRFLTRIIFCMFAGDVGLLPKNILTTLVNNYLSNATNLRERMQTLFSTMQTGGDFGADRIKHFNGGLFAEGEALLLTGEQARMIREADQLDWSSLEPSIFGTLFERVLDPARRKQIGAHYTSRSDIELIVKPALMAPLEREWAGVRAQVNTISGELVHTTAQRQERIDKMRRPLQGFIDRLATVTVLDPACGSGNFLYVSLALLKGLEQEVIAFGASKSVTQLDTKVHPRQLHGIETDAYAHELASMVVWIGYLQWKHKNGIPFETETPILEPLTSVQHMDAIIDRTNRDALLEPDWPSTDVIVGNPPFLGGKLLRRGLGDDYVEDMFKLWHGRVRREADLCCYWHEKARAHIEAGKVKRAGLLATQSIRGGANRETLERIKASGDIFFAESDRKWILNGAAVHVSMLGFDDGSDVSRILDGISVTAINANLTSGTDLTLANQLMENTGLSFMGDTKVGPFEIDDGLAQQFLAAPNPHGKPNSDVVRPWVDGMDITRRNRGMWIIDFPPGMSETEAALYAAPFKHVLTEVRPFRATARSGDATGVPWWIHQRSRPDMRRRLSKLRRYMATPNLTKYRFFVWLDSQTLPDHQLIAFARDDDYFFGVLHSHAHELWARATGTQLREVESGFRYTPTTCFETFALPWPPGTEPATDPLVTAIGDAAAELNELRTNWLNPPPGALPDDELQKRTLTNLYNESPTWLRNAHRKLDKAVLDAYGWPHDLTDEQILARLLDLNLARAKP